MPDPANPSRSRHARWRLKRAIGSKRCGGSWPPAEPLSASVLAPAAREWAEQPVTEETLSAAAARSERCCHSMGKTPGHDFSFAPRCGVAGAADARLGFHLACDEVRSSRIATAVLSDVVHRWGIADPRGCGSPDLGSAGIAAHRLARHCAARGAQRRGLARRRDPGTDAAAGRAQLDP